VQPASLEPGELIRFGWQVAEATLAVADSELRLVTHWFQTGQDDSVNADDHFGSDERTLRFLGVALPTLVDQLGASAAVVAVPWEISTLAASLTVVALAPGAATRIETRALTRLDGEPGAPFWRLEPGPARAPAQLAATASRLSV
jgi:hypothetical protein